MTLFPDRFSCQGWQGTRAKHFAKPEDAFQQLVGDALIGRFSAMAHVASTAGRDGSIDAWVEANALASGQFDRFSFPLIVECKHHDELAQNPGRNIEQGWREVKRKLAAQATEGWLGLYAPWKQARAYLYCISSRLPNQQVRTELQQEIRDFLAVCPTTSARLSFPCKSASGTGPICRDGAVLG